MSGDFKYALRTLRRSPGFTTTAVLALALAIAANTAIFSVVNAVLLQPLPYPDPGRIVQLRGKTPTGDYNPASIPRFMTYRGLSVLQDVTAYDWNGGSGVNLGTSGHLEQVRGEHVSLNYFRLFGAHFVLGRPFVQEEDRPGGSRVVVLSRGLWQRRFAADPNIVGKAILLGGDPYTVIGVTGTAFAPDPAADLWLPLQANSNSTSHAFFIYCAARLRPGVTLAAAQTALAAAAVEFRRKYPDAISPRSSFTAEPLKDNVTGEVRPALVVLLAAVGCILLIACANVAGLLLARGLGRGREMAIRTALGATRGRIVRQLAAESLVLAALGGALGVAAGAAAVPALLALNPGGIPRIASTGPPLDARVLGFAIALAAATAVLFGLAPALQASRADLVTPAKNRTRQVRGVMVTIQIAFAVMLLTAAGLLLRTFGALHTIDPGFDARHVLTLETSLDGSRFSTAAAVAGAVRQTEDRIRAIPDVLSVAVAPSVPLESSFGMMFNIDGRAPGPAVYHGGATWRAVTPGYFDVFRIPILRGRAFTPADNSSAPPVVLVNWTMAREKWPGEDPVGRTLSIYSGSDNLNELHCEVIGIVGDVYQEGLREGAGYTLYVPFAQLNDARMAMVRRITPLAWAVRTHGSPQTKAIEKEIRDSAGLPPARIRPMEQVTAESLARDRFNTFLMTVFAVAAMLLAAVGIYGLMSFTVHQRTVEFGIRMALGADADRLRNLVVRRAMLLAGGGVAAGLAGAAALTRLMSGLLFGVQPRDPLVFAVAPVLLAGVALAASYFPAQQAAKLEPLAALRHE